MAPQTSKLHGGPLDGTVISYPGRSLLGCLTMETLKIHGDTVTASRHRYVPLMQFDEAGMQVFEWDGRAGEERAF